MVSVTGQSVSAQHRAWHVTGSSEGDVHLDYESKVQQLPLKMFSYALLNIDVIIFN